jgi:hypothetical protein
MSPARSDPALIYALVETNPAGKGTEVSHWLPAQGYPHHLPPSSLLDIFGQVLLELTDSDVHVVIL